MEDILKKRRFDFLLQVAMKFNAQNRGVTLSGCYYSAGCAIGQHLEESLNKELDFLGSVEKDRVFDKLPTWMQSLGREFLYSVQTLHDGFGFWNEFGLTKEGYTQVRDILDKFVYNG